jgi:hypothetical protein
MESLNDAPEFARALAMLVEQVLDESARIEVP